MTVPPNMLPTCVSAPLALRLDTSAEARATWSLSSSDCPFQWSRSRLSSDT